MPPSLPPASKASGTSGHQTLHYSRDRTLKRVEVTVTIAVEIVLTLVIVVLVGVAVVVDVVVVVIVDGNISGNGGR